MIILGIDPGIATTGFGVIKYQSGKSVAIDYGVISTTKDLPHPERLGILQSDLMALIKKHQPDRASACIEGQFLREGHGGSLP